jgi:hypothetical protein
LRWAILALWRAVSSDSGGIQACFPVGACTMVAYAPASKVGQRPAESR